MASHLQSKLPGSALASFGQGPPVHQSLDQSHVRPMPAKISQAQRRSARTTQGCGFWLGLPNGSAMLDLTRVSSCHPEPDPDPLSRPGQDDRARAGPGPNCAIKGPPATRARYRVKPDQSQSRPRKEPGPGHLQPKFRRGLPSTPSTNIPRRQLRFPFCGHQSLLTANFEGFYDLYQPALNVSSDHQT